MDASVVKMKELMTHFSIMRNMIVFLKDIGQGGLKIPGNLVCQCKLYSHIVFHEVVNDIVILFFLKY